MPIPFYQEDVTPIAQDPQRVIEMKILGSVGSGGVTTETTSATPVIDLSGRGSGYRVLNINSATTFSSSAQRTAGTSVSYKLICDGTNRALNFPAGWRFVGTEPTQITANKIGVLAVVSFGTTDAEVVAAYQEEA